MIPRQRQLPIVEQLLQQHPLVGIIGARQVGKTALAFTRLVSDGKRVQ